jgi:hypothetical protein
MPSPKPCLKAQLHSESDPLPFASYPKGLPSPHVHFPPTPSLTSMHVADSPRTYDRAPIVTSQNWCALPERGDRTYSPTSESWNLKQAKGSYFHPDAYEACEPEPLVSHIAVHPSPSLIPDVLSESDESDGPVATLSDSNPISVYITQYSPIPHSYSRDNLDAVLSFLPHSSGREREKGRKRRSPSRPRLEIKSSDVFSEPALDGCLGGF